jgi:hypothetical protein
MIHALAGWAFDIAMTVAFVIWAHGKVRTERSDPL